MGGGMRSVRESKSESENEWMRMNKYGYQKARENSELMTEYVWHDVRTQEGCHKRSEYKGYDYKNIPTPNASVQRMEILQELKGGSK